MKKRLFTAGCAILVATPIHAAPNCCGKCAYDLTNTACTENCCDSVGTTESSPDANNIITITTTTNEVVCATNASGTNIVRCAMTITCKCEQGYYGTPTWGIINGCSGTCTRCPSSGGVYGTTAAAGATSITECYIPSGTTRSFSDSIGSGTETITSNCYYTN